MNEYIYFLTDYFKKCVLMVFCFCEILHDGEFNDLLLIIMWCVIEWYETSVFVWSEIICVISSYSF